MDMRWRVCSMSMAAALAVSAGAYGSPKGADNATTPPAAPLVLNIRLEAIDSLPMLTRIELMREATSIWRDGRVRLNWPKPSSSQNPPQTFRVAVVRHPVAASSNGRHWPVGQLLRFADRREMAQVSTESAERVLARTTRPQFLDGQADYDRRLGVVLGRAVAHEIGHYLLHTGTHAESGLMRASFLPDEFSDARIETFSLDDVARAHLHLAAAAGPEHWVDRARSGFSYSASAPPSELRR
jgi:hypothetical protein